jgi:ubiquinone/menaquinone biosynthesis C-methylase UbiE
VTRYLQHITNFNDADLPLVLDELSLWASRFGVPLLENVPLRPDMDILDVGCGTGFPLLELANTFGPSCSVVGIDIWKEALKRATSKLRVHILLNVQIVEADAARMPFEASRFDLIVSNLGINNFEDPQAVMAECFRVARPGATIALTTNVTGHMREFYDVYCETLVALNKREYLANLDANEAHRGTKESVRALVEGAGFEVVRTIEGSFQMRYLDGSALLNHTFIKIGFLDAWRAVVGPEDEEEVFGALEGRLNEIASKKGDLRLTVPTLYVEGRKKAV